MSITTLRTIGATSATATASPIAAVGANQPPDGTAESVLSVPRRSNSSALVSRQTRNRLKKVGQLRWYETLLAKGETAKAERYARSVKVGPFALVTAADRRRADAALAVSAATQPLESTSAAATPATPASAHAATSAKATAAGGAGVSFQAAAVNRDQLGPGGENLQLVANAGADGAVVVNVTDAAGLSVFSASVAPVKPLTAAVSSVTTAPVEPHSAASATPHLPASPRGEVEGETRSSQAFDGNSCANGAVEGSCECGESGAISRSDSGEWPQEAEGTIGVGSRNKFYCDVKVGERWAKCAKGGVSLMNGEKVKVKLVWVSGDGRDAEYEVVERVEIPGAGLVMTAPPVGFEGGSLRAVLAAQGDVTVGGEPVVTPVAAEKEVGAPVELAGAAQDYVERIRAEAAAWAGAEL